MLWLFVFGGGFFVWLVLFFGLFVLWVFLLKRGEVNNFSPSKRRNPIVELFQHHVPFCCFKLQCWVRPEVSFCVQSSEIQQENVHSAQFHGGPDSPQFLLMLVPAAVSHAECPVGSCINPHGMKNFSLHEASICSGLTGLVTLTVGLP